MSWLELKIPPPLVALSMAAGGWWLSLWTPVLQAAPQARTALALGLVAAGLAIELSGVWAFRRARTTVNPLRPERASALVDGGIYRWTRNPMYVGMALLLTAWAVHLGAPAALLAVAGFVVWIQRFQIRPEERHLRLRFGADYEPYCARVRRWV